VLLCTLHVKISSTMNIYWANRIRS
jgi:hypothetical protein